MSELRKMEVRCGSLNHSSLYVDLKVKCGQTQILTVTRPIRLPPYTPVAQKIAEQRWLIATSAKNMYLFI